MSDIKPEQPNTQPKEVSESPHVLPKQATNSELQPPPATGSSLGIPMSVQPENRAELLARARIFLTSPQVHYQDNNAKRGFLREKGLNEIEIDDLLRNLPTQIPSIPPRTYPQLPPSNLPVLLLGLARLFSWLAGGSAVAVFLYHRFLLPRITQTSLARQSLRSHHLSLMRQLTTSLSSLKESQAESFSVLPRPNQLKEPREYSQCRTVADIVKIVGEEDPNYFKIPPVTILRCGIEELGKNKDGHDSKPTTEDLFRYLEGQIPWLITEEGSQFEKGLWDTLSSSSLFSKVNLSPSSTSNGNMEGNPRWEYVAPFPVTAPPLLKSLESLSSVLPKNLKIKKSPFQHTLQSLSDFTGYISTQVYMPYRPPPVGMGVPNHTGQNSVEDEFRREIRALKGLVLNRRSFMPSIARPSTISTAARTTP